MANPFGEVVDNYLLDRYPIYVDKKKTQEDRAREAWMLRNDNGKDTNALTYVRGLKAAYGNGITTHIMVYNATGDTLRLVAYREGQGHIGRTPYPLVIGNGQWASFLHVKPTSAAQGSSGFLVYRAKNASGQDRDFLIGWRVPWKAIGTTFSSVLCDVGLPNTFQRNWNSLFARLNNSFNRDSQVNKDGAIIEVDIGTGTSPFYRAILKTPYSPRPPSYNLNNLFGWKVLEGKGMEEEEGFKIPCLDNK